MKKLKELEMGLLKTMETTRTLRPVTSGKILEASSHTFDPEGLFSTEIFGAVGSKDRNTSMAYIDLHTEIIHPMIYKLLTDARALFAEIMRGTTYALWDKKEKTFIKSADLKAKTGYRFFVKHLHELKLEDTGSTKRKYVIKLLKKYNSNLLISRQMVIPAGLRDYVVDPSGKPKQDPINDLYRKALSQATVIPSNMSIDSSIDGIAFTLQTTSVELYEYLAGLVFGKHKIINAKLLKRRIHNSSSNVLTSTHDTMSTMDSPTLGTNDVYIGLHQYFVNMMPKMPYILRASVLAEALPDKLSNMRLINTKTLVREFVDPDPDFYETFMSEEGMTKLYKKLSSSVVKQEPVIYATKTKSYYLALKYEKGDSVAIVMDPLEIPEEERKYLSPLPLAELMYMLLIGSESRARGLTTRYPSSNEGSSFPVKTKLKVTSASVERNLLTPRLEETGFKLERYPVIASGFFDSYSISTTHYEKAGADTDGDKMSLSSVFTEQAIDEIDGLFHKASYYKGTSPGEFTYSTDTLTTQLVVDHMVSGAW